MNIDKKFFRVFILTLSAAFGFVFFSSAAFFASAQASEEIKIIDMAGREAALKKAAGKAIALNSASRFIAYLLAADKLCGIENIDKNFVKTRPYTIACEEIFAGLDVIGEGGVNKPHNIEKIISLGPELIFEAFCDKDAAALLERQSGVKVISLGYGDKNWFDEKYFFDALTVAARALGRETRAVELASYVKSLGEDLKTRAATIKNAAPPRCYIGAVSFRGRQGIASTDSMYFPFTSTGAHNAVSEISDNSHIFLDREKLLVYDPEYIFIDAAGLEMVREDYAANPQYFLRLSAVKNKKVYMCLPSVFYNLNIEVLYANSYFVGKIINPGAFKDIDPAAKADEIFEKFCGKKCYDEMNSEYRAFSRLEFTPGGVEIEKL
ncbi:MAG TPA: ABC transporter substrate-binding protein [Candidatus Wallbacteria bacterium]|nr:ABC transporter substrate-binding protein [Candidatus Wallbacteria bacterium]